MNKKSNLYKIYSVVFNSIDLFIQRPNSVTSTAPHVVDNMSLKRYIIFVILALVPSVISSIYNYGLRTLAIIAVSYTTGLIVEAIFSALRGHEDIHEGFFATGLLFPLILPPTIPLWMVAVGSAFGIFFGKEVFGGTGRNIFNPALVGRIFITIAFPVAMSTVWQVPMTDTITSATPLSLIKTGMEIPYSYWDLLIGRAPGSMGETFRLGIIITGVFLMITKVSNWRIPVSYLGTVAVLSGIGSIFLPGQIAPPLLQLLTGGLLFGAFFMATDPVTAPYSNKGKWIYGLGLGLFTILIRSFAGYTEGVMFSIILMNAFSPLVDSVTSQKKYKPIGQ